MKKWMQTICAMSAFLLASVAAVGWAQEQQLPSGLQQNDQQQARLQPQADVLVTVNGDPITRQEVRANVQAQLEAQPEPAQQQQQADLSADEVRQQVIDALIEARLVEQYVRENGPDVEEQEVDAVIEQLKGQLAQHGTSFEEFLAARGHTEESFERRVAASVAWQKFQQQQLTDENLQQFYQQNPERFPAAAENPELLRQQLAQAYLQNLWEQIVQSMKPEAEIERADRPGQRPGQNADPGAAVQPFDPQ